MPLWSAYLIELIESFFDRVHHKSFGICSRSGGRT
jgi:RNA polymerase-binding transcription factor DksA